MTWLPTRGRSLSTKASILLAAVLLALTLGQIPALADGEAVQELTGRIEPGSATFYTVALLE